MATINYGGYGKSMGTYVYINMVLDTSALAMGCPGRLKNSSSREGDEIDNGHIDVSHVDSN